MTLLQNMSHIRQGEFTLFGGTRSRRRGRSTASEGQRDDNQNYPERKHEILRSVTEVEMRNSEISFLSEFRSGRVLKRHVTGLEHIVVLILIHGLIHGLIHLVVHRLIHGLVHGHDIELLFH